MRPYSRSERIAIKIQKALTELLNKKLQDPRIEMATISHVKMSPDLKIGYVYVTMFGSSNKAGEMMDGFQKSKGYIKKSIAPKLGLKYMPELRFIYDDSFDKAVRMDLLIKSANEKTKKYF